MLCEQKVTRLTSFENHLNPSCEEFSLDLVEKKCISSNWIQLILHHLVKRKRCILKGILISVMFLITGDKTALQIRVN